MVVEGEKSWTDGGFLELWLANILSDSISTMSDDVHKLVDQFRLDSTGNATVDEVPDT